MKKLLLLAGVATVVFSVNANACDWKPYISAKITASDLNYETSQREVSDFAADFWNGLGEDSQHVWGTSFAAGAANGAIRAEIEWHRNTAARYSDTWSERTIIGGWAESIKTKIKTDAILLNAYYDFDMGSAFTPYIGAGIGYAKSKIASADNVYGPGASSFEKDTVSHTNIAWQLGAGIAYAVNDNVSVDVGYRYVDYGKFDVLRDGTWGDVRRETHEITANELYAGIRYSF